MPPINAPQTRYFITQRNGELSVVRRFLGAATARAGGAVEVTAADNQDTGMSTTLQQGDSLVSLYIEGLEGRAPDGSLDDQVAAYNIFERDTETDVLELVQKVVEFLQAHPGGVVAA